MPSAAAATAGFSGSASRARIVRPNGALSRDERAPTGA